VNDTASILRHERRRAKAVRRTRTVDVISLCVSTATVHVTAEHRYNTNQPPLEDMMSLTSVIREDIFKVLGLVRLTKDFKNVRGLGLST